MPTYEYRCENGHDFERFQKMSDEPLKECPECGAPAERRISSGAGLVFKGSGFYITDYKNAGRKKESDSAKSEGSGKSESSGGDGDGGSSAKSERGKSGGGSSGGGKSATGGSGSGGKDGG